jgi:hypothetical protein
VTTALVRRSSIEHAVEVDEQPAMKDGSYSSSPRMTRPVLTRYLWQRCDAAYIHGLKLLNLASQFEASTAALRKL